MTLKFTTTRAIGAAIALTLGSVASVAAQTPVRKDVPRQPAPTPAPTPMPEPAPAPVQAPTPIPMPDTVVQTTTTTEVSTGEAMPMDRGTRFGNGFYVGLAGQAAFPQNRLNDFYRTGYGAEGHIGWDPANSPLGLRLNLGYTQLNADTRRGATLPTGGVNSYRDPQIYQGTLDAKLRLPFGRLLGATSGLYAVGGGGVHYFRNYANTLGQTTNVGTVGGNGQGSTGGNVTNTFNSEDKTRFGANVGGGLSFGIAGASLFAETRYVRVFTPNTDIDYLPVTLGLTFNWR